MKRRGAGKVLLICIIVLFVGSSIVTSINIDSKNISIGLVEKLVGSVKEHRNSMVDAMIDYNTPIDTFFSLSTVLDRVMKSPTFSITSNINNHEKIDDADFFPVDLFEGYILFTPEFSLNTFLINQDGEIINKWLSRNPQGIPAYLLENGSMIRGCAPGLGIFTRFIIGGFTGSLEMYNWDGNLIWSYIMSNDSLCIHNDIEPLPNGNILVNAWEYKTVDDAIERGWCSNKISTIGGFLIDCVLEIEPIYPYGGKIVWGWHEWDHLIQDYDATKENYGVIKDHPELIDINAQGRLRIENNQKNPRTVDFSHMNSIDYNQDLDQILLSLALLNEIIIIDHSTTIEEAAGHNGGIYERGGDLLYRWGNSQNYRFGGEQEKMLFGQHDVQ